MESPPQAGIEWSVTPDQDLISGNGLARIKYRRNGVRKWSSFVVVLDAETTFEIVEANAGLLITTYEGQK